MIRHASGGEDLHPVGAVGALAGLDPSTELDRGQRQSQAEDVRGHVGGVREQGEAARDQTSDDLHDHVRDRQGQGDGQRPEVLGGGRSRSRAVVVPALAIALVVGALGRCQVK